MGEVTHKLVRLGSLKLVTDQIEDDIQVVDDKLTEHSESTVHLTPADREKLDQCVRVVCDNDTIEFITVSDE